MGAVTEKLPPRTEDRPEFPAAKAILATLLKYPGTLAPVLQLLEPGDWPPGWPQDIFVAMRELFDQGQAIDPTVVVNHLAGKGLAFLPSTYECIIDLWLTYASEHTVLQHCHNLKEHSIRRRLESAGQAILRTSPHSPVSDAVSHAEQLIADVAQIGAETHVVSMAVAVSEAWDRIDAAGLKSRGLATGFADADEITGGLQASELVIIAARPSVGKTALAINLALEAALRQKVGVFFASLEQSRLELTDRMLTGLGRIDGQKVRHGRIGDFEVRALKQAGEELRQAAIWLDDEPVQTSFRIAATARRLHAQHPLGLIIVDYLQIVESENRREPRHEQVSQTAKRLKGLARELKIPVVALAQLNRSMEETSRTRRPRLSDLRESGGIEAAADTVWLLHRADDQIDQNPQVIDVQIAKQRNGPVGEFLLHYFRAWTTFQTPDLFPFEPTRRSRGENRQP